MENQNQTSQPETLLPAPKKWYQHAALVTIIILALIAGTVIWVYLILNQPQDLGPIVVLSKHMDGQPITNNPSSSTSTLVSTENWQTFIDNSLGVTIKFPSQWYVFYNSLDLSSVNPALGPAVYSTKNDVFFKIDPVAFQNSLPIEQWYKQYYTSQPLQGVVSTTETTVDGLPALEVQTVYNYTGKPFAETHYFVGTRGGNIFDIQFKNGDQNYTNIYQTIVDNLSFSPILIPNGTVSVSTANIFQQAISTTQIDQQEWSNYYDTYSSQLGEVTRKGQAIFSSSNNTDFVVSQNIMQKLGDNFGITGMVGDPQNQNLVFISTSNYTDPTDVDKSSCTNQLYSYNAQTGDLVQFYSALNQNNSTSSDSSCSALSAVGIEGSKLVLLTEDPDSSPGSCFNLWSDDSGQYLYIDLANIQNGLQKFTVPQDLINSANAQEQQCKNAAQY